jgi:hypothetical protein
VQWKDNRNSWTLSTLTNAGERNCWIFKNNNLSKMSREQSGGNRALVGGIGVAPKRVVRYVDHWYLYGPNQRNEGKSCSSLKCLNQEKDYLELNCPLEWGMACWVVMESDACALSWSPGNISVFQMRIVWSKEPEVIRLLSGEYAIDNISSVWPSNEPETVWSRCGLSCHKSQKQHSSHQVKTQLT